MLFTQCFLNITDSQDINIIQIVHTVRLPPHSAQSSFLFCIQIHVTLYIRLLKLVAAVINTVFTIHDGEEGDLSGVSIPFAFRLRMVETPVDGEEAGVDGE